jgi:hypothetical protein
MKRNRRAIEVFSLSFLDVVSCGFGAIILLLVLIKVSEPLVLEEITTDLSGDVVETETKISEIKEESQQAGKALKHKDEQLSLERNKLSKIEETLTAAKNTSHAMATDTAASLIIKKQMEIARQQLTEEMKRLQLQSRPVSRSDSIIGGVPVDSEYIIFIIDTSGSMKGNAWHLVRKKMREILAIYPKVKGLQVMNDMGDYMFSQYAGKWIRDTPSRRKSILKRLTNWNVFSNSSPVEGVTAAIKQFYSTSKKISIYIFGDDFSRGSIQEVVDTVARVNNSNKNGGRVRIHAVGFPVLLSESGAEVNVARFAALMRRLAEDNNGSFVGINSLE